MACIVIFQIFIGICLCFWFSWPKEALATDQTELSLCELISQTPNYSKYKLHNKANCLAHVKSYDKVSCLRNDDNQVKRN